MAIRHSYEPGTPCWVDVTTRDAHATSAFYAGLFGWAERHDPAPGASRYGLFALGGHVAAGFGPTPSPDVAPAWTVYVSVADAEATMARVIAHGGAPLLEPVTVVGRGRVAVARDVAGDVVGLWQPAGHIGSEVVNDTGAFSWNELATDDLDRARRFYTDVFAWEEQGPLSDTAAIFTVDGRVVCGAHTAGSGEPRGWSVWFGAVDCDAAAARVAELGGRTILPPSDMGFGRGAIVADPQGAVFGIAGVPAPAPM